MCFVLYLAADGPIPQREWDPANRHVHTGPLTPSDDAVHGWFSLPNVVNVGSNLQCGCGFRNIARINGDTLAEMLWEIGAIQNGDDEIANHRELCALVDETFRQGATQIELSGCWNGEEQEPLLATETLTPDQLSDPRFCFREGNLYRLSAGS